MKKYTFTKIEHFLLDRYTSSSLTEDHILYIFAEAGINEKDYASLLEAIEDTEHPKHEEVCTLLAKSKLFNECWIGEPEDYISSVSGDYDSELFLDHIEDDDIPDFDSLILDDNNNANDEYYAPANVTLH